MQNSLIRNGPGSGEQTSAGRASRPARKHPFSIRTKLILCTSLPVLLLLIFVFSYYPHKQHQYALSELREKVQTMADMTAIGVGIAFETSDFGAIDQVINSATADPSVVFVILLDKTGKVLVSHIPHSIALNEASFDDRFGIDDSQYLTATALTVGSDIVYGNVIVGYSLHRLHETYSEDQKTTLLLCLTILFLGLFIAVILSYKISNPIRQLRDASIRFGRGDYDIGTNIASHDEIGDLANAFKTMIDDRKIIEDNLRKSETFQRILVEALPDLIFVLDVDGVVRKVNRVYPGHREEDIVGQKALEFIPPEFHGAFEGAFQQALDTGRIQTVETEIHLSDGCHYFLNRMKLTSLTDEEYSVVFISTDISERRKVENVVRRLATIVEQTAEGIAVSDLDGNIQFANQTCAVMHGYESGDELVGKNSSIFHTEEQLNTDVSPFNEKVMQHGHNIGEVGRVRKNGTIFPAMMNVTMLKDDKGAPYALAGFMQDITERKQAEKERQMLELEIENNQARKLEAVGSLAAGIAHEINTPIQYVGDNTNFLSDSFESLISLIESYESLWQEANTGGDLASLNFKRDKAKENAELEYLKAEIPTAIEQTLDGVRRVSKIVRAMKDFSRSDQGQKTMCSINEMLESTLTVAQSELKYVADVEIAFCQDLPTIDCYRDELNQVFLNLLINAAHAIKDIVGDSPDSKGIITVSTLRENNNVIIKISDTGKGIPRSIQDRIFDPFFSTKEVGKGSGQGLHIARKIVVEKHKGSLDFETEEGKGATFIICLPITIQEVVEV